jgi:hypothetical protein
MKLLFDDDLVEEVVFFCASGRRKNIPALQIRRFQSERERAYAILDPDDRNTAFARAHLTWFSEWGMEEMLENVVRAFPLLPDALSALGFRKARHKSDEGAELYVNTTKTRRGIVALRPEQFRDETKLTRFLNHELSHLSDMVDLAFAYSPDPMAGLPHGSQRLARERYRLLWDITIDGRLSQSGKITVATREARRAEFEHAFAFWVESRREQIFEQLWSEPAPTHARLLALASDPRDLKSHPQISPGAPCPLCGFPTFAWAETSRCDHEIISMVIAEFTHWSPDQGACQRCMETYRARQALGPGFELA